MTVHRNAVQTARRQGIFAHAFMRHTYTIGYRALSIARGAGASANPSPLVGRRREYSSEIAEISAPTELVDELLEVSES